MYNIQMYMYMYVLYDELQEVYRSLEYSTLVCVRSVSLHSREPSLSDPGQPHLVGWLEGGVTTKINLCTCIHVLYV